MKNLNSRQLISINEEHTRGGSRIYKGGGLAQGTNLLGRGVLELGESGGMPPQEIFEK